MLLPISAMVFSVGMKKWWMIANNHVFVKKEGAILLLRNHLSTFRLKLSIFYPLGLTFASLKVYDRVPKRLILVLSNALLVGVVLLTYFVPTKITFGMLVSTVGYFSVIINSAPFILIDIYRARENYPTNRGLANDNSVATLSGKIIYRFFIINRLVMTVESSQVSMDQAGPSM